MPKKDKRQIILNSAEELFVSRRFDQVTLEDIRIKAKVGKGTIYRFFQSKEDLYAHVLLAGLDTLYETLSRTTQDPGTHEEKLKAAAQALEQFFRHRRGVFRPLYGGDARRMMRTGNWRAEFRARKHRILEPIAAAIREGIVDGRFRATLPPEAAARIFMSVVREGVAVEEREGTPPVSTDELLSLFLSGIRNQ
ncbi:MAG: TetR/AcrR family transcriptional regulator [Candidatus Pacebacteria bacterium]|nr:TetR/AcrR family transcriptional regulator [Candidatus Paceibacterota bacterium]